MPRKSTKAPTFKSESEEADWYASPAGRRSAEREFVHAIKEGTLIVNSTGLKIKGTDPKVLEEILKRAMANTTRAISPSHSGHRPRARQTDRRQSRRWLPNSAEGCHP